MCCSYKSLVLFGKNVDVSRSIWFVMVIYEWGMVSIIHLRSRYIFVWCSWSWPKDITLWWFPPPPNVDLGQRCKLTYGELSSLLLIKKSGKYDHDQKKKQIAEFIFTQMQFSLDKTKTFKQLNFLTKGWSWPQHSFFSENISKMAFIVLND